MINKILLSTLFIFSFCSIAWSSSSLKYYDGLEHAKFALDQEIKLYPEKSDLYVERARLYMMLDGRDIVEKIAINDGLQAISLDPINLSAYVLLSELQKSGEFDRYPTNMLATVKALDNLINSAIQSGNVNNLYYLYYLKGIYQQSEKERQYPSSYDVGKERDLAIADFNESIRLNPNWGQPYYELGRIYYDELSQYDKGAELLKKAEQLGLETNYTYYMRKEASSALRRVSSLYKINKNIEWAKSFEKWAKDFDPNNNKFIYSGYEALNYLEKRGWLYWRIGEYEQAIEDYKLYEREKKDNNFDKDYFCILPIDEEQFNGNKSIWEAKILEINRIISLDGKNNSYFLSYQYFKLAQIYVLLGDFDSMEFNIETAKQVCSNSDFYSVEIEVVPNILAKDYLKAINLLNKFAQSNSIDPYCANKFYYLRGYAYAKMGDYEQASSDFLMSANTAKKDLGSYWRDYKISLYNHAVANYYLNNVQVAWEDIVKIEQPDRLTDGRVLFLNHWGNSFFMDKLFQKVKVISE